MLSLFAAPTGRWCGVAAYYRFSACLVLFWALRARRSGVANAGASKVGKALPSLKVIVQ
jgi:hypothetical protein